MENRITLVMAHRLSTVIKADKIFVVNRCKIAEDGTHTELSGKNGAYDNLYSKQFEAEN